MKEIGFQRNRSFYVHEIYLEGDIPGGLISKVAAHRSVSRIGREITFVLLFHVCFFVGLLVFSFAPPRVDQKKPNGRARGQRHYEHASTNRNGRARGEADDIMNIDKHMRDFGAVSLSFTDRFKEVQALVCALARPRGLHRLVRVEHERTPCRPILPPGAHCSIVSGSHRNLRSPLMSHGPATQPCYMNIGNSWGMLRECKVSQ